MLVLGIVCFNYITALWRILITSSFHGRIKRDTLIMGGGGSESFCQSIKPNDQQNLNKGSSSLVCVCAFSETRWATKKRSTAQRCLWGTIFFVRFDWRKRKYRIVFTVIQVFSQICVWNNMYVSFFFGGGGYSPSSFCWIYNVNLKHAIPFT